MNKIKGYRAMCHVTQREMAVQLGMSLRTYVTKEADSKEFTINQLNVIVNYLNAKGLNVTVNDLI
jgi:DNA-binding XRE family transcriptional regulator